MTTRNRIITKDIDGWKPPDTDELANIVNQLNIISTRIHALRIGFLLNSGIENGRIRRLMARRGIAMEKAYKKGKYSGRRKRGYHGY